MSNFPTQTLSFEGRDLTITDINGIRWLRCPQIGDALGLSNPRKAVQKIFSRHREEFSADMSAVLELDGPNGRQLTRLFSPRGAALIAMLAKTPRAAAFRAWVLTVLETTPTPNLPALPALPSPGRATRFLTPEARALLRYHCLGLSGPEIAKLLDKSPKTISRWRADLRAAGLLPDALGASKQTGSAQHGR